jgi:hypothetical protein
MLETPAENVFAGTVIMPALHNSVVGAGGIAGPYSLAIALITPALLVEI